MNIEHDTREAFEKLKLEREAQLEGAKAALLPFYIVVAGLVFVLCFWRFNEGLVLSIGAALLTILLIGLGVAVPVGYFLGKRAAKRLKSRLG
jgi:Flp pilus assembly protein TadB